MLLRRALLLLLGAFLVGQAPGAGAPAAPAARKRVAILTDSWYPWSHADVIGMRLLEGYRLDGRYHPSPVTVDRVYLASPRPDDRAAALAPRYRFRVVGSVREALVEGQPPRLAVDGILVTTRINPAEDGPPPSPGPRRRLLEEVVRILDEVGGRPPIFIDKLIAENWEDSRAIVAAAARRRIPLMGGSVLGYVDPDRPLPSPRGLEVALAAASSPYWAFAFHALELLQAYVEARAPQERGVRAVRVLAGAPDRAWGGDLLEGMLAGARTRRGSGRVESTLLVQYADETRGAVALVHDAFDDSEFLVGARLGARSALGGLVLPGEPYDHFGALAHAVVAFITSERPPIPIERTLLTTGLVLRWAQARTVQGWLDTPDLLISYPAPRR